MAPWQGVAVVATSSAIWVTGTMQSEDIFFSNGGTGGGSISTYPSIANSVLAKVDIDNGALLVGRLISGCVTAAAWRCFRAPVPRAADAT